MACEIVVQDKDCKTFIDAAIDLINQQLALNLTWLQVAYPLAEKSLINKGNTRITHPKVYVGNKKYKTLLPDKETKTSYSFFYLDGSPDIDYTEDSAEYSLKLLFWVNQTDYNANDYDQTNILAQQVNEVINTELTSLIQGASITLEKQDVWSDFGYTFEDLRLVEYPYTTFLFTLSIKQFDISCLECNELPFIGVTVTDGEVTTNVPAGSSYLCTPCQDVPTNINYAPIPLTGQTVSYRVGDDGWRQINGQYDRTINEGVTPILTDFYTLDPSTPNAFNNTERFTAIDGTQNFGTPHTSDVLGVYDGTFYMIDHFTGLGYTYYTGFAIRFPNDGRNFWELAIDNGVAMDFLGFTNWFLCNRNEANQIYDATTSTVLNNIINQSNDRFRLSTKIDASNHYRVFSNSIATTTDVTSTSVRQIYCRQHYTI